MIPVYESNPILSIHCKDSSEATTTTQRLMIQQQPIPQLPKLVELLAMLPLALQIQQAPKRKATGIGNNLELSQSPIQAESPSEPPDNQNQLNFHPATTINPL
jgi:hypothetical protein